jgi:pyruvate dehydrogenase E1 component alpha subunit
MHLFDAEKHMLGGNGIVGAQIPVAAGVAFKIRYRREDGVVLCYFGDGAIHQGSFHESLNMAAIWRLPIVFICENNQFGMGTRFDRVSAVQDFSLMGTSYGIPGRQVDGMDVLAVHREVGGAIQMAKKEGKPSFLEIKTYRYKGHSMSDPATYRTREEVDDYKKQDPIFILQNLMERDDMLTPEEFEKMDGQCRKICDQAVQFAEESQEPALETLYEDVLA